MTLRYIQKTMNKKIMTTIGIKVQIKNYEDDHLNEVTYKKMSMMMTLAMINKIDGTYIKR